jgi:hypothetical protein
MKKNNYGLTQKVPTANLAVNKSRIKIYNDNNTPTYYLTKGQEFQIEIFNPTQDTISAKIILNGKAISQGGLVLRAGERVFLDRYLDVAKKFMFDTYEVSNTEEVREAIEKNGDFKVEFYRESRQILSLPTFQTTYPPFGHITYGNPLNTTVTTSMSGSFVGGDFTTTSLFHDTGTNNLAYNQKSLLCDSKSHLTRSIKAKKTIETGTVEKGSNSDQKIKTVDNKFEFYPFHSVEYKMLPLSQKVLSSSDINVKRYCTNCGSKLGKTDKFCSSCGTKA